MQLRYLYQLLMLIVDVIFGVVEVIDCQLEIVDIF